MKKSKIAAMLLVTFTALSLGACGGQSSGQGNSSEATASGDSGQEQSTASDSGNGGTQDNTEASAEGYRRRQCPDRILFRAGNRRSGYRIRSQPGGCRWRGSGK